MGWYKNSKSQFLILKQIQMSKFPKTKKTLFIFIFFPLLFIMLLFNSLRHSLFLNRNGRVNVVFYGQYPRYYSLGLNDNTNFSIDFFPDLTVMIPGGYGFYRVGALGKLANLEKKTDLYKKTFSFNTASFVDYYFYPKNNSVYFGNSQKTQDLPDFKDIFLLLSNANIFDRLYLYLYFLGKKTDNFKPIQLNHETKSGLTIMNYDAFLKKYRGYLYSQIFRKERKSVQIKYKSSYKTAFSLGELIEGEGIRVIDVASDNKLSENCSVIEDNDKVTETAKQLAGFFGCQIKRDQVERSDIILELGNKEVEWEIN